MTAWIRAAREACRLSGHSTAGDYHIGRVLSRAPVGGTGPHEAVQILIESLASEDIERGFRDGVIDSRGITWRSPDTGGEPERLLAERFRHDAAAIAPAAPRMAAVLRAVADNYRQDARWQDQQRDLDEYE